MSQTQEHKRKISLSEREVVVIQRMVSLLQTAKAGLERDLSAANQFIDRVEAANAELENQLKASDLKVTLLEVANIKLDGENNDVKVQNARLEGRITHLETQLSASKENAKVLEASNAKLDSQFNTSNNMNDRLEAQIAELQHECATITAEKDRHRNNFRQLYIMMTEAQAKLAMSNNDLKRQTHKLISDVSQLREDFNEVHRENVQLRALNAELDDTVQAQRDIIEVGVLQRQRLLGSTDPALLDENILFDENVLLNDEESVTGAGQDAAFPLPSIEDIPDFSVGVVNGESWGTNYNLEEQFEVAIGDEEAADMEMMEEDDCTWQQGSSYASDEWPGYL